MDPVMALLSTTHRPPGGIHWLALLALTLSGCAGWPAREIPDFAPHAAPQGPFALNSFEFDANTEVIGRLYFTRVQGEETLLDIARAYDLGYDDIIAANPGVDHWTPVAGERVLLPLAHVLPDAPREGIVINLAARRLFYYPPAAEGEPRRVITHPIGIGREGWSTPLGNTEIAKKHVSPAWTVPASIRRERAAKGDPLPAVVPPGPDNPLGSHALRLGWSSILIHGTNKPAGIGMQVSHGCIQLYPEDIVTLFADVLVGTPVTVVDQPYLAGTGPDGLLLETHTPATAAGDKAGAAAVARAIEAAQARQPPAERTPVDRERVLAYADRQAGYPLPVATGAPAAESYLAGLPAAPLLPAPEPPPAPTDGDWYVDLGSFNSERSARRLVSMLGYQGPPIPAKRLSQAGQYQVLAGPYLSRAAAVAVAKRIARDLDETGTAVRLPQLADASDGARDFR
jgi:L,D-transpeptidase ErfK/SrfK